jgi:glycosyltransferase involved in cell wall biosynthesis
MTPIRLAYLQSHLSYGSVEAYLQTLIERVDRDRFEPWLVCPDHPSLERLRQVPELEGRVVTVPSGAPLPSFLRTRRRALRSIRPALVHCADFDPPGMLAARGANRSAPVVVTYNTPELRPEFNVVGRLTARAAWAVRPWVIFTSAADRETGVDRDPIAPARAEVIPYGIDMDRFAPREGAEMRAALGIAPGRRVVGTVGYLREQKQHTYLLQAAERLDRRRGDIEWLIVGDGELRGQLEEEVRTRELTGKVHFLGNRDDVAELLAAFDVFALSSDFEGMCFAVAEALAVEVPVVSTDVGGVGQSVVHEETGLLVPTRDVDALASSIERLLDDGDEAARLARAGRLRVEQLYAVPRMVEATERLYLRALGREPRIRS